MALPVSMRAAVYKEPRVLAIEERPLPEIAADEVLLQVSHCGVCGTDLHLVLEGMGAPGSIGGHEYSGRIVAVGSEVSDWQVDDAVVGGASGGCGRCSYCRARRPSLCSERSAYDPGFQGAFADYKKLRASELLRVPDGVSLREAALAEPLAVALHALTIGRVEPAQRVLVTGAGPLGLLVVAALRARGVADLVVSEPSEVRRERAGRLGATALVKPEELEAPPMPFTVVERPFDVAFECSGNPHATEAALAQLVPAGTLVIVGTGLRRPRLDHNRVLMNELIVTGAYCYDADGFRDALALLESGALSTELLIEPDDVPLDGLFDALCQLERQERAGKVMIVPGPQTED
jgi:2-desacetyl-2-hydroxyethyl bacteriochlorophyllide A dehydrogenase